MLLKSHIAQEQLVTPFSKQKKNNSKHENFAKKFRIDQRMTNQKHFKKLKKETDNKDNIQYDFGDFIPEDFEKY